jgi:NAD(P)-dependent dehydrogenase (short-subunit alcohol dehydrogenase family)
MDDFRGRVAVVTGGGSGLGRGIVLALAREGAHVVIADVELPAAEAVASEARSLGVTVKVVHTDVASYPSVLNLARAAYEDFGAVHVLCNNAGVNLHRRGIFATHEDWLWILGVNLWGPIHGIEAFLPRMLDSGVECYIVNTASINGMTPNAHSAMYSTSKYGLIGLTDTLRNELAGTNVGISALCPAGILTSRITESERNRPAELAPPTPPPPHTPSLLRRTDFSPPRDPLDLGSMVIKGIRERRSYIFTDMKSLPLIETEHEQMIADFDGLREWEIQHSLQG